MRRFQFLAAPAVVAQIFYFRAFRIGACIPSTCSAEDIEKVIGQGNLNRITFMFINNLSKFSLFLVTKESYLNIDVTDCQMRGPKTVTPTQIVILCVSL